MIKSVIQSFFIITFMLEIQAQVFAPNLQNLLALHESQLISNYGNLQEEYGLYRQIFYDRCRKLQQLWRKEIHIDVVPCSNIGGIPHCISKPEVSGDSSSVTFKIAWFDDQINRDVHLPEDMLMATSSYWVKLVRPLVIPFLLFPSDSLPEPMDGRFLERRSKMIPPVVLLHELTHLLLRLDFILDKRSPVELVCNENHQFEQVYQQWIAQTLQKIHKDFRMSLLPLSKLLSSLFSPSAAEIAVADQYQNCWGGRDEIFVIVGAKFSLNGKEHVLGETRLLRKIAQNRGLPSNFICWSHCNARCSEDEGYAITAVPSSAGGQANFYKGLFIEYKEAWLALFSYLGFL